MTNDTTEPKPCDWLSGRDNKLVYCGKPSICKVGEMHVCQKHIKGAKALIKTVDKYTKDVVRIEKRS